MNTTPTTDSVSQEPMLEIRTELELARVQAQGLAQESLSANTRRLYDADWQRFSAWVQRATCANDKLSALPATDETMALYICRRTK